MISQATINELKQLKFAISQEAAKFIDDNGFVSGKNKYKYQLCIKKTTELHECIQFLEELNVVDDVINGAKKETENVNRNN